MVVVITAVVVVVVVVALVCLLVALFSRDVDDCVLQRYLPDDAWWMW